MKTHHTTPPPVVLVDEVQEFASRPLPGNNSDLAAAVARIRDMGRTRAVLRDLPDEAIVRVLGQG